MKSARGSLSASSAIAELVEEHAELRRLMRAVEESVGTQRGVGVREELEAHLAFEERVLFPLLEGV
jgi:iron-sulfur cluster repair protein YtfE (RIC family)